MTAPQDMDLAELAEYIRGLTELLTQRQIEAATADEQRKQRIAAAETALVALLGPDNPAAGQGSIREMLQYADTDLHEHSGLALRLVLTGMEIQTRTMLDLVRVVGQAG